jgi:hypothetical protein
MKSMPKSSKTKVTADKIAEKASRGEDISAYFTNKFTVVRPMGRVYLDERTPHDSTEGRSNKPKSKKGGETLIRLS